jgi:hypothetical protein
VRERLRAALSPNGRRVHLARAGGSPVCGSNIAASCVVRARITCSGCRAKRPRKAARFDGRPHVVEVDWSPLYAALGRALNAGATEAPPIKVQFWPVLAKWKATG